MANGKTCFEKLGDGQSKLEMIGRAKRNGGTPIDEKGILLQNKYRCGQEYKKADVARCYDMISEIVFDNPSAYYETPIESIAHSVSRLTSTVSNLSKILRGNKD